MKQLLCPVDGKPCERDCPDRYRDRPAGGCFLTTFLEFPTPGCWRSPAEGTPPP